MSTPAKCLPSATAMAATFDTAFIERGTRVLLAEEVKLKAASRTPLGGRSFESYSEDPHLSGMVAAAFVSS
ncbi:glycoside hydrolase family 3 protein [Polyporus arcularius HHB13444]|uniref:Glycoside hydrolase family 3 protein n=1 Tax=Polyporus arcularius HHB13444 TaxID=1314778 RepID=A0A5C3NMY1_9APHY|nr:glycoside hydrolase family 3 protein [Polyporus arcularius HHB13444]